MGVRPGSKKDSQIKRVVSLTAILKSCMKIVSLSLEHILIFLEKFWCLTLYQIQIICGLFPGGGMSY
jgi:hypothetical protein